MVDKKDMSIIKCLRQDARRSLSELSRQTKIPISTIFDRLKNRKPEILKQFTCLLDFSKLGFGCQVHIAMRVKKEEKADISNFLLRNHNVNSVYKINNGYDFMVECIFRHVREVEEFMERLEQRFKIQDKNIYYVIEEIARECFLTDESHLSLLQSRGHNTQTI